MKKIVFSGFILLFLACVTTFAQEETQEKSKTRITLDFYKNSDNTKTLISTVSSKKGRKKIPLKDVIIHFYVKSIENNLGGIQTNNDGEAIINLPEEYDLAKDSLGNIILIAKFDGNDTYKSTEKEITVRDTRMELSFSEIDSVKTITITVNEIIGNDKEIPLEEVDISFYVHRLFGLMKIGEGWIENGESSIEFPNDITGDTVGNVTVIAKIEDNDIYGNIKKEESITWGVPVNYTRENSGINLSLLYGVGSHKGIDSVYLGIIIVIVILIFITIVFYKRS